MQFKRRITSKDLGLIAKDKNEYDFEELLEIQKDLDSEKKSAGLKEFNKYLNVIFNITKDSTISCEIALKGMGTVDYLELKEISKEYTDVFQKVEKTLQGFKKKHPDFKIVKSSK